MHPWKLRLLNGSMKNKYVLSLDQSSFTIMSLIIHELLSYTPHILCKLLLHTIKFVCIQFDKWGQLCGKYPNNIVKWTVITSRGIISSYVVKCFLKFSWLRTFSVCIHTNLIWVLRFLHTFKKHDPEWYWWSQVVGGEAEGPMPSLMFPWFKTHC